MTDALERPPVMEEKKDQQILDTLYVIDFDRTLVDTSRLADLLMTAVDTIGYDSSKLREKLKQEKGKSFQLLAAAEKVVGSEKKTALKEAFMELAHENSGKKYSQGGFFEPGAHYLIGSIPREERMVFTYGDDEEWQTWKLEAAGLTNQQYMITTEKDEAGRPIPKPKLLTHMRREDGVFVMRSVEGTQTILARSLVMIDDKPSNLTNLPEGVIGYLYYPRRVEKSQSQEKQHDYKAFLDKNKEITRLKRLRRVMGGVGLKARRK